MTIDLRNRDFIKFCQTADPLEVLKVITGDKIRGLDKLALSSLSAKRKLPEGIRNLLLAYFFSEFANKVYHRNDLSRIYDYWAAKKVMTVQQAEEMMKKDIHTVLKKI